MLILHVWLLLASLSPSHNFIMAYMNEQHIATTRASFPVYVQNSGAVVDYHTNLIVSSSDGSKNG